MKKLLIALLCAPLVALASEEVKLDRAPIDVNDKISLQRGAKLFVNYCLNCHSASYMRYSQLTDLGLSEEQIEKHLLFTGEKVGQTMDISMDKQEAKDWFGATPPDLTVVARSRGADWLYTYLRGFYVDPSRPTGWNNVVYDKVAMPHVLYDLQGEQVLKAAAPAAAEGGEGHGGEAHAAPLGTNALELVKPGTMTEAQYDTAVADLVNFLQYMGEPAQEERKHLGVMVLLFLGGFFVLAYYLKKEYWKDVH